MPWFWQSETTPSEPPNRNPAASPSNSSPSSVENVSPTPKAGLDWRNLSNAETVIATALLTTSILLSRRLYKTHLRRIPNVEYLKPQHFTDLSAHATGTKPTNATSKAESSVRARTPHLRLRASLLGVCTSTHDPDNFRLYHTPLGRLALWRAAVPTARKDLKDQTLHVRIAGIDAPELAHFGKPAQPYAEEALRELRALVEGRRVRVWLLRRDQYNRVVGMAFVSRGFTSWLSGLREEGWWGFWRKDVGLEMLRRGAATVYEGSFGAEYGGWEREVRYRAVEAEAKKAGRGMWSGLKRGGNKGTDKVGFFGSVAGWLGSGKQDTKTTTKNPDSFESPREYKQRMARLDEEETARKKRSKM